MNSDYIREKIEEHFKDFSEEIKNHLIESFEYLYQNNNQLISELFELLCSIKEEHPNFIIEFSNKSGSQFDCDNEKIILARKNYLILIHEIAHSIHYYYNQYSVPDSFNNLQKELLTNQEVIYKSNLFIQKLDERIKQISNAALDSNISDYEYDMMLLEQKCLLEAKDFIDAFFKGKTDSGHGEYYYSEDSDNKKAFSEMFATYVSIKSFDSSGIVLDELRKCLGDHAIEIFNWQYQEINEQININRKMKTREI